MIAHYIIFNGQCAEAIVLYEKAFGARVVSKQTYGDTPGFEGNNPDLVMHADVNMCGSDIMCSDAGDAFGGVEGEGKSQSQSRTYLSITTDDEAFVRAAWDVLAEGGSEFYPLQTTFFAKLHGSLTDRFGVNFMFTVE